MNKYPEHSRVEMEAAPARRPGHDLDTLEPVCKKLPSGLQDLLITLVNTELAGSLDTAERMVPAGLVSVNGEQVKEPGVIEIRPDLEIRVGGEGIRVLPDLTYEPLTFPLPKPPFAFGDLSGPEGNSFEILGKFQEAARRAGWPKEEIDRVIQQAVSGDYEHLLRTISDNVSEQ